MSRQIQTHTGTGGYNVNALRSMLRWDMRLQARYGFYAVYAVLTVIFILGLRTVGPALRTEAAVLLIVTDPTVLGFYFIAAMVLFEKEEGVLDALVMSPLGDSGYLISKVITLSLLAVVASTLVAVFGHGNTPGLAVLICGVSLAAALFVLIGFVAVARFDSINEYFISSVGWGTVLFLPLFGYVGIIQTPLFYVLPAQPVLLLVEGGFRPLAAWEVIYAFGYLLIGNAIAFVAARSAFRRHIVRGGTPGRQLGREKVPYFQQQPSQSWLENQSPLTGLMVADIRNWIRDPLLAIAAVGPFVLAVIIRFGTPSVTEMAKPVFVLEAFYPVITASMVALGPSIYGFVVGMFILEDREQGVLAAYRTSPLSAQGYLFYRGTTAYVLSVVATLPALAIIGLVEVPFTVLVGSVMVGAFGGSIVAFVYATLASNSIEGIALSKLLNLIVLGPAVVIALVPEPLQFAAAILPTYWPVKAVVAGVAGDPFWALFLLGGLVVYLLGIAVLGRRFASRAD